MWLLYCVFQAGVEEFEAPQGVEDGPVSVISTNGLGVAISRISPSALNPTLSRIRAYQRVIEAFHRHHAVIPMRYGSACETQSGVLRLLEEHSEEYRALLDELGDAVEMGIRILLPPVSGGAPSTGAGAAVTAESVRAYLAARREWYAAQDRAAAEQESIRDRICTSLGRLFVRSRTESASLAGSRLLSLYFLVPRNRVEVFRQAFRELGLRESAKLLLSGPWPPYNFVLSARIQKPAGGCERQG
jgi:hypothetical protein